MKIFMNKLILICCMLCAGCSQGTKKLSPEMVTQIVRIKDLIAKVCACGRDKKPVKESINIIADITAMTNVVERNMLMEVVCKTIASAELKGENLLERQSNYSNLQYFCTEALLCLGRHQNDLHWQMELWFSEGVCFRKEESKCIGIVKEIKAAFGKRKPAKIKPPPNFEEAACVLCEWETSERQSKSWYWNNMSWIVLWDDSIAARYCATLSWWEKMKVVWRIKKVIGRYPDWYLEKKGKSAK